MMHFFYQVHNAVPIGFCLSRNTDEEVEPKLRDPDVHRPKHDLQDLFIINRLSQPSSQVLRPGLRGQGQGLDPQSGQEPESLIIQGLRPDGRKP